MTDVDARARQRLTEYAARFARPLSWGHSTVAHRDLGYCSLCVREGGGPDAAGATVHELTGWQLLAIAERGLVDWTKPEVPA